MISSLTVALLLILIPVALTRLFSVGPETSQIPVLVGVNFVMISILCSIGWQVLISVENEIVLQGFDLDGDGVFSERELTPQAARHLERMTGGVGGALAPTFGVFIGLMHSLVLGLVLTIFRDGQSKL